MAFGAGGSSMPKPKAVEYYAHHAEPITCEPSCEHPDGAVYYVSVIDGKRSVLLSGPYKAHGEALAMVPEVRTWADTVDPRAPFYAFGTVAVRGDYRPLGAFDSAKEKLT